MRSVLARSAALLLFAVVVGITFLNPAPALADGLVVVQCPDGPVDVGPTPLPGRPPVAPLRAPNCPNYLSVKNHNVTVTIDNQVARTHVDQTFLNESTYQLEGTYLFPLPEDAAITDFAMWVDGKKLEGQVLDRNQASQIYQDIVRKQQDPALLEYMGRGAFRARIFPIPPRGEKRVEIEYTQVLKAEGGLVRYLYPLNTEKFSARPLANVSINVSVKSPAALKSIYSPSHTVAISRDGAYAARVGYEAANVKPDRDFVLYYSVSPEDIGLNLLSYRLGNDDGFFLLLLSPNVQARAGQIVAKDVILILDTSGSMQGPKLDQAKRALTYVLDQLNPEDRFNILAFSTGTNAYASRPQPVSARENARSFVAGLRAEGSTDINRALLEALSGADAERPTIVIFLTDGLPTVGETSPDRILSNVTGTAKKNIRLFPFGVGDDVNTFLLDSLADKLRGASGYVRPTEKIDEIVSGFYAKVATPVLSDVTLDWGGSSVSDVYPYPLPDLFAGTQLVVAGRYRGGGPTTLTLKGMVNGVPQSFRYGDVTLRASGGDDFIPRLWATRKIGYLLNEIRLHGESKELVNEIVTLAVRYGILTPYTSFLVDERKDVLTEQGRGGAANDVSRGLAPAAAPTAGAAAVQNSQKQNELKSANAAPSGQADQLKLVGTKTFVLRNGVWTDTGFDPTRMTTRKVEFNGEAYYALLATRPDWAPYLAVGTRVIVVLDGVAYEVTTDGSGAAKPEALPAVASATPPAAQTPAPAGPSARNMPSHSSPGATPIAVITSTTPIPVPSNAPGTPEPGSGSDLLLILGTALAGLTLGATTAAGVFVLVKRKG